MEHSKCYKCGRECPPDNDASIFDAILLDEPLAVLYSHACHLLPVYAENGVQLCIGSPSRAQYIEGQARDQRPEYAYKNEQEEPHRVAYTELLRQANTALK